MKRIIFLVGVMFAVTATVAYGQDRAIPQITDVQSKEARHGEITKFVNGYEAFAEEIIANYWKEVKGIAAKDKAEKHHKTMDKLAEYFHNRDFNLHEWLLVQQEFDKRYEVTKSTHDKLGSDGAYGTVRHYLEKNLPQSLSTTALDIVSDKRYSDDVRLRYIYYLELAIGNIYNKKGTIEDKDKLKILIALAKIIEDKTNATDLRAEAAFSIADYFGNNEKAVKTVLEILSDPQENEKVKSKALFGISKWGVADDVRIKEKIAEILKNRDKYSLEIINNAIRAATRTQDREATKILLDILQNTDDEKLFIEVRRSLGYYDDKEVIKAVLRNYCRFGEEKFLFLDWKDDILIAIMDEESIEYLPLAIKALGESTSKEPLKVIQALEKKLYHSDPKIKIDTVNTIRKIGQRGGADTKNQIIAILNEAKAEETNKELIAEIENSVRVLESE